jgi:predicted amidohydrolase
LRAAAIQLNSTADAVGNLAAADRLVRKAAGDGATLVVLPEKWPALGPGEVLRANAQELNGPIVRWALGLAAELGIDIVAGSMSEQIEGHDKLGNTSVHAGPDGTIKAVYRKVHLFDVEVAGRSYHESEHESRGEAAVLSAAADGTELGLSICYDLRFGELYSALAVAGARVLCVPAAFTLATTRDHWLVLLRARAIENQCFVVAANQVGEHPGGMESGGASMIIDPWGTVLAQVPGGSEGFCIADLDLAAQDRIRAEMPVLGHRVPTAYRVSDAREKVNG